MKKISFLYVLFQLAVIACWGQYPPGVQEQIMQASAGWQEYTPLIPSSSVMDSPQVAMIPNIMGSKIPGLENTEGAIGFISKAIQGKFCPDNSKYPNEYTLWIFKLNENDPYNTFASSPRDKSGMVRISGIMDLYRPGSNYCDTGEMEKVSTGPYNLNVNFKTFIHSTPRNFQIMGTGKETKEYFKNLRELKKLYQSQLLPYLKAVREYKSKPHITNIGGNGNTPDGPIDTRRPVKSGTEDTDAGWKASRDGMGFVKNSLEAISKAVDFGTAVQTASKIVGAGTKISTQAVKATFGLIQSAANVVGVDFNLPNVASEAHLNATVDNMLRATAKAMEQYAPRDPAAKHINEKSKVDVQNNQDYKPMIDASFMISTLSDAFDQLDNIEQGVNDANLPSNIVEGTIIGPGIYERLEMSVGTFPNAGGSSALSEQGINNMPKMFEELEQMGYAIPDEVKSIDIKKKLAEAQAKMNSKGYDLDISKPMFNFFSHTTSRIYHQGREAPDVWVYFQISSPDEYVDDGWINDNTIFKDNPLQNDETEPEQSNPILIWVATDGNDTNENSHTYNFPLATLQKALEVAHKRRRSDRPVNIILKDGVYGQSTEIDWSASRPQDLSPLTISAENDGMVIFKGTLPISDDVEWTRNIKKEAGWDASLPLHPNQLTYNPGGDIMTNPPPVLMVNGNKLIHFSPMPSMAKNI